MRDALLPTAVPLAFLVAERESGDLDGLGRVARGGRRLEVDDHERRREEGGVFGQAAHASTVLVGSVGGAGPRPQYRGKQAGVPAVVVRDH
jgi:hypothetical protein